MMDVPNWLPRDVSRETLDKLDAYKNLLEKWTRKINLISRSSRDDIIVRHIWDSAQIYQSTDGKWVDLGSGGGLPAVVLAILADGWSEPLNIVLIESDQRKAAFLRTCARELGLSIAILPKRIHEVEPQKAQIVSARALMGLPGLIDLALPHLSPGGIGLFMKGAQWEKEVEDARKTWKFSCEATPSKTHPEAAILKIGDIERA